MPAFTRILTGALALAAATQAQAHATLEQAEAAIGATAKFTLRVPHGCAGEATEEVRIEIPDGVYNVKPMPKAGWDLATETGAYAEPYDNHGREMTEGVRAVIWSGGRLEDGWYDEFTFRGAVGPQMAAGTVLRFPALQTCATGTADWTDTSGAQGVPNPAPALTLVAATEAGHGHAPRAEGGSAALGALRIEDGFVRATLPNQPVAGAFLTVTNDGPGDDRLIAVASPAAGRMEIHEMAMDGDVMRMREIPGGLTIPAGGSAVLEPGATHLMLMDLSGPLEAGSTAEVTLTFETAGDVTLTLPVLARGGEESHAGH